MNNFYRLAGLSLVLSAAMLCGCAGATRLPMRTQGPGGERLQTKHLDMAFLDTPGTPREEVVSRLSSVDTGYSNPRLFWGRWSVSKWGYWWVIAGNNNATGDAKRIWHLHNVLVSFDEGGAVSKKELFDGDKSLWAALHTQLADGPPLDLSQPMRIEVLGPGKLQAMVLGNDSVEFELRKRKALPFQLSPRTIVRFSHGWVATPANSPLTCHELHFADKSPVGKSVRFCATPANVAATFQYLEQYGSPQLRWD